ncbi:glycosyltransferase family 2 protein [Fontibacillus sp. BL9]|uniref:glycosyltransferase family 2 protein n=1 Tax=Fontibacillus sp. BL9 TaxID=3389971 RepID=UPI00397C5822
MIAFILSRHAPPHLKQLTEHSLLMSFPDLDIVHVQPREMAEQMNSILSITWDPWFLTLEAGEIVGQELHEELISLLQDHTETVAGVTIQSNNLPFPKPGASPIPRGPLLWSRDAVMASPNAGFREADCFPFERYLLLEKMYELAGCYKWLVIGSEFLISSPVQTPFWKKESEEWKFLFPLLQAASSSASGAGTDALPEEPIVTIVICSHNDSVYLPWAVRSVMAQSFHRWELIVIDDGSTDDTKSVIQELPQDLRVRTYLLERNFGKALALNYALDKARGHWLLELDADDWLAPACVGTLLEATQNRPDAVAVCAGHVEWTERMNKQLLYKGIKLPVPPLSPRSLIDEAMPVAPRMFKISTLREHSGWNVEAPYEGRLYEDLEILTRLALHHEIHFVSEPLYHRRIRSTSITHRQQFETYRHWRSWMLDQLAKSGLAP